jgi:ATP-dependent 26S proteasome regulatory subunit
MDQERWNLAQTLQQLSSYTGSTRTMNHETSDGEPGGGGEICKNSRYRSDMEQALAMKADKTSKRFTNTSKEMRPDDVILGLSGLDQAFAFKEKRQYQSALKLYELSLELLIKFLGKGMTIELPAGLSRTIVEARVHEALSDAEAIKIALKEEASVDTTRERPNDLSPRSVGSTVSTAIAAAIQRMNTNSTNARTASRNAPTKNNSLGRPSTTQSIVVPVASKRPQLRQRPNASNANYQPNSVNAGADTTPFASEVHQTILRDFYVSPANLQKITWDDIAGLENVKQALQEAAILPLIRPDLFTGLRKPRNILLYGPPGTGKTLLVKAVANESHSNLLIVTSSALTSKWMGEAEKLVRSLFEVAHAMSPSMVFIDEMDALLSSRKSDGEHEASRRLKTEFMVQIDGIVKQQHEATTGNVLLLACTNCPWDVDSAVLRRFPRRIYVPLPDADARKALLQNLLSHQMGKHSINTRQLSSIVRRTEGFSCSDITAMASEAAFGPIRSLSANALRSAKKDDMRPVDMSDFDQAIQNVSKSVSHEQLQKYSEWNKQQQAIS